MTASADKVQFLLESLLEQTLPLVKKGIFSQQQLRQVMIERQKHQNKLYSFTYKLSHHLKAIEFEYDFERQRLYRIKNQQEQNTNPLYRKQSKTDFSIIRRIIKLWDRTMHKYRFRTYLWKQYLSFCIIIKSKKHFYKALTNALRFLPFQLQLWKIGVRYQVQIGRNLWKARKLFHKGLKLVPSGGKSIELTKQLIKFQLQFVQTLQSRQKIIQGQTTGQGENELKFIMGDGHNQQQQQEQEVQSEQQVQVKNSNQHQQPTELLKLREYHDILLVALVDSITKNYKSKSYFHNRQHLSAQQRCQQLCDQYLMFLTQLLEKEDNQLIQHILNKTINKLEQYKNELTEVKLQEKYEENDVVMVAQQQEQEGNGQGNRDDDGQQDKVVVVEEVEEQQLGQKQQPLIIQEEVLTKVMKQQAISKQQLLANHIMQTYTNTSKFDQKAFTKSIKQLCLKPSHLSSFLQRLLPHFLLQCLTVLSKNPWLRIPINSLEIVLRELNRQSQEKGDYSTISSFSLYLVKQFQKINPIEYITNTNLLKQVITFNRIQGKVQENNRLFRSLLVNCKQNIEFLQRAKGLFIE